MRRFRLAVSLALILSTVGGIYAVYRATRDTLRCWREAWSLQQTQSLLAERGWKLACYAGMALALAALSGWLWRKKGDRHRGGDVSSTAIQVGATEPVPLFPPALRSTTKNLRWRVAAASLLAAWALLAVRVCRKWFALAHDGITCDGVLISLLLLFAGLVWLGLWIGLTCAPRQRRADFQSAPRPLVASLPDRWLLAAVVAIWSLIFFAANQLAPMLSVGATLAASAVLGYALLHRVGLSNDIDPLETLLLSVGLGAGLLGLATLALGHLHLLYWWIVLPAYLLIWDHG